MLSSFAEAVAAGDAAGERGRTTASCATTSRPWRPPWPTRSASTSRGLARHAVPAAIPRTLWRVRTDLVSVERATTSAALPEALAATLGPAAATMLRAEAALATRCAASLRGVSAVERQDIAARHDDFDAVFAES